MERKLNQPINVILHGEAMIFTSTLPKNVKKIKPSNTNYHIIADSETTGNHHVVDVVEGVEFYTNEEGRMFFTSEKETQVRCIHANRHDTIKISPGTYEWGSQQEYDHLAQHMQKVRD